MIQRSGKAQNEAQIASFLHMRCGKKGIPLAGNFELTARCNFSCRMCYVHQEKDRDKELSAEEWISLGRTARDNGMLFLLLTGGEPFLRSDFARIYTELRKMGLMISINTNGSLLTDELMEIFRQYPPTRVNVSLYGGSAQTYRDLCRNAAYETVTANIRRMKEAGLSLKINFSVTPYNAQDIEKIHDFGKENGIPVQATTYMYPPVRINGEKYGTAPDRFNWEDAAKYMVLCREQYLTPEQLLEGITQTEEDALDCTGETGMPMNCRAGKTAFWVTWDGRMLPCGMFPNEGYSVRSMKFEEAWQKVRDDTASIMMPAECSGCSKREKCAACAAACIAESGDSTIKPEYICNMTQRQEDLIKQKYGRGIQSDENK